MENTPLHEAIRFLGGQAKAAPRLKRKQSTLSEALKNKRASAELCMEIERETEGKFTCEQLRPDLAELFKTLRDRKASPRPKKRAERRAPA